MLLLLLLEIVLMLKPVNCNNVVVKTLGYKSKKEFIGKPLSKI